MFKLSFSKPKYSIYQEGEITVCSYDCSIIETKSKKIIEQFKVNGKSILSKNDKQDILGRRLAESRAKAQAYKRARDLFYSYYNIEQIKEEIENLYYILDFYGKAQYLKKQEDQHINYLLHEN